MRGARLRKQHGGARTVANTYLGSGVAIPHGLGEDKGLVRRDGVVVLQFVDGIEWNPGQIAHLVVGIAASSDSHITILRRLTRLIQDEARLKLLATTDGCRTLSAPCRMSRTGPAETARIWPKRWNGLSIIPPACTPARPGWRRPRPVKRPCVCAAMMADPRNLIALLQLGLKAGIRWCSRPLAGCRAPCRASTAPSRA
jgi:phosphocarrier protein FPr